MNKLLITLLAAVSLNAYALGDQEIINPINGDGVWILAQRDCNKDKNKGTIYAKGQALGCWWTNLVAEGQLATELYISIDGTNYVYPTSKIQNDININNSRGMSWQSMMEINNAFKGSSPAYIPPVNTYYYGAGGGYVGRSTSF